MKECMKECGRCKRELPVAQFNKNVYQKDGLHRDCRSCKKAYQAEWYQRHKTDHKARTKAANVELERVNKAIVDTVKSQPCTDCGVTYPPYVMDLDHLPGTKKVNHVSGMLHGSTKKLIEEIGKCEVVCANCHRIRTFSGVRSSEAEHSALTGGVEMAEFSGPTK